ncbi:hypothetical protein AB1L30_13580 [Bremerella sp. JC817]|uniref:hypothetical protein n=1 Tax=Bremerella sp. JC817 TaxID=3231756 RepID=UPI003458743D
MIVVRPFINSDPPKLVELWNHQPVSRGLAQPMTIALLEAQVFAKPYFLPANLLVAEVDGKIAGMAHLVPDGPLVEEGKRLETANIPILLSANIPESAAVEDALLTACEARMAEFTGRAMLLGGTAEPGPFYFGLAKGSCNRGTLVTDTRMNELAARHGYVASTRWAICHRTLRGFRPPVDRNQIAARRALNVVREDDPPFRSYHEACIYMHHHQTRFSLVKKLGCEVLAQLTIVQMEAFSHLRGVRTSGIVDMNALEGCDDVQAQFFLAETLRQVAEEGTSVIETQVATASDMLTSLATKLDFETVDEVHLLVKRFD